MKASISLILCLLFTSTLLAEEAKVDFGSFDGTHYVQNYFGFKVAIPSSWQVQDAEARDRLMQLGKDVMAGSNQNMKAMLDAADLSTLNLLTVFRHPLGTAVDFNPSFVVVAEKVSHLPGIQKGSDYLFHTKRFIQQGQLKYKFDPDFGSETIGGVNFDYMTSELDLQSVLVKQKFYSTIRKGYAFCFVVSYDKDDMKQELANILKTAEFKQQ